MGYFKIGFWIYSGAYVAKYVCPIVDKMTGRLVHSLANSVYKIALSDETLKDHGVTKKLGELLDAKHDEETKTKPEDNIKVKGFYGE